MQPDILKTILDFGGFGALSVIIFLAYDRVVKNLAELVKSNTAAMQHMADISAALCDQVSTHDRHISSSVDTIQRIDLGVARIESKVDQTLNAVANRSAHP